MRAPNLRTTAAAPRTAAIWSGVAALTLAATWPMPAAAHPHVWVSVVSEFLYDGDQNITGVRHQFTFDEMFSATVGAGLDADGNGKLTREELVALAKENVESLHEYGYFTVVKIEDQEVVLTEPVDYYSEGDAKGIVSLHFTLPFAAPVKLGSLQLSLTVLDPTNFIAFGFAAKDPIVMAANAPKSCTPSVEKPEVDPALQQLDDAFAGASGGVVAGNADPSIQWPAQKAFLKCGA